MSIGKTEILVEALQRILVAKAESAKAIAYEALVKVGALPK